MRSFRAFLPLALLVPLALLPACGPPENPWNLPTRKGPRIQRFREVINDDGKIFDEPFHAECWYTDSRGASGWKCEAGTLPVRPGLTLWGQPIEEQYRGWQWQWGTLPRPIVRLDDVGMWPDLNNPGQTAPHFRPVITF